MLHLILALPLLTAAFVDVPGRVSLGPVSGLGALTIGLATFAAGGVLVCGRYPLRLVVRVLPYLGFLAWMGLSVAWAPPDFSGIQNGILYVLFGSLLLISGVVSARHPANAEELIHRCVLWIDCVALGIIVLVVVSRGLPTEDATSWWVGPRSIALLALIPLSWHLAGWYYGVRGSFIPTCLWLAAVVLSLSRTVTAISLVLLGMTCFFQLRFRLRNAASSMALFLVSLTIATALVLHSRTFRDRVFGGDVALQVGSARINTEGRMDMWQRVISSARESPIAGKGLGSSMAVLAGEHPHNDYLRIWHDLGVVGLLFFLAAAGGWLVILFRSWYQAERHRSHSAQLELAGALGLLGVLLAMVTDNVIVYVFVMGPLGVLVGAGLGLRV